MMDLKIDDKTFEPFIDYDLIEKRIRVLAIQINLDYENKVPIIIGVLNGSFMFMADLMKQIHISCEIAFLKVSSYHNMESTGEIKEEFGLNIDITNRDVLLVEDIIDTGNTLDYLIHKLKTRNPASIKVASLLLKPDALQNKIDELTYVGFEIANDFVVGYGLDYNGIGRNTKHIYRLKS